MLFCSEALRLSAGSERFDPRLTLHHNSVLQAAAIVFLSILSGCRFITQSPLHGAVSPNVA